MIWVLKIIPILLSIVTILGTFFDFIGLDGSFFSYLGGMSFLPLLFLYLSSYVFGFCSYHRMFLHYIVANNIVTLVDYHLGIPVTNRSLFLIHVILVGVFLFLVLYCYRKEKCCKR